MNTAITDLALGLMGGGVPPVGRARRAALGGVVIATFAATTYVALVGALWFALLPRLGPAYAWLVVAGLAALGALIAWGVVVVLNRRAREKAEAARALALQAMLTETALTTLPRLLGKHPFLSMALAAGLVFALTPSKPDETD